MSASSDAGISPHTSGEDSPEISDTESGSSYAGSGAPDTPACPYQSSEFPSYECSRYHDCPTHLIERNVEDYDATSSQFVQQEATPEQLNGVGGDGVDTEDLSSESSRPDTSPNRQVLASDAHPSQVDSTSTALEHINSASPTTTSHTEQEPVAEEPGITLREALHQTAESLGGLSMEDRTQSPSTLNESQSLLRDAGQNSTTPPVAPSESQRSTSSLNLAAPPFSPRSERRSPQEFALPRWQPDSEVTYCPICHTQFSFFVRKHHCRKCGRVVCNSCSPHKITIPHQYIVRPPGERAFQRYSFLGDEGGIADFSALGGGEQVRLCNPCVPDPNTTPPQTQHSTSQFSPRSPHLRSQSSSNSNYNGDNTPIRYPPYVVPLNPAPDTHSRSRSVTMSSGHGLSRPPTNTYLSPQNRIITGTPPAYYPQSYSGYRHTPLSGHRLPGASLIDLAGPSSSSSAAMNRPLPPPPQIPEEDECPICHRELPSRELPNFEARRESHINNCIIAHSTYSPSRDASGRTGNRGTPPPRTARRTGMFPYLATEKDCVDSAECTICLEEFEVGVPMARLECLCRFHRSCITAWFVDHPGRCPVHQHDSFGY
ncbi:FYVE-domain-containing protein [Hypoxylon crocopeplum]|nr:FYVE-domain-containing protein [Hypoxylon crocopeplum]